MPRPLTANTSDPQWQSARAIRRKLGVSDTAIKSMALAGNVRVRTTEAVIHLYNVTDVEEQLAKKATPKEVDFSAPGK